MHSRLATQELLQSIIGERGHVYFQPPESIKIEYPAFIFSFSRVADRFADDLRYLKLRAYDIQYISKTYDEDFVEEFLNGDYRSFKNYFCKDNLHHFNFLMFY